VGAGVAVVRGVVVGGLMGPTKWERIASGPVVVIMCWANTRKRICAWGCGWDGNGEKGETKQSTTQLGS
jgi:hypothetical protein